MDIPLDDEEANKHDESDAKNQTQNDKKDYQIQEDQKEEEMNTGILKFEFYEHVLGKIAHCMLEESSIGKPSVSISTFN